MAPEIVLKTEYCGPPADIWAVGVLLFTMLCGQFPYRGATDEELYNKICKADYHVPLDVLSYLSVESLDLISKLFCINADERLTAKQVLSHPWLKNVVEPKLEKKIESDLHSTQKRSHSQKLDGCKQQ